MENIKIYFNEPQVFKQRNFKSLKGITGLYFIFLDNIHINYPFKKSKLIYIGMSEKRTNSIGNRLSNHYDGKSGNVGILNYKKADTLLFTYLNFEMIKQFWNYGIENLESYFILDFVEKYGSYPICNNKSGYEILDNELNINIDINWAYFR
jgi:hypothetical protein